MTKKLKLSPWHKSNVKPVHVGVYEVDDDDGMKWYSFWNGKKFGYRTFTVSNAFYFREEDTCCDARTKWRGILK